MKRSARNILLLCCCLLLGACSASRTGIVDGKLTTNQRPAIGIKAVAPFALADSGRIWSPVTSEDMAAISSASFDYAIYADPAVSPASRFAYAAIIRLENESEMQFTPQGQGLPGSFGTGKKTEPMSREGRMYTLHVPAEGDWASDTLTANGTAAPEAWLAKRWVFSIKGNVRAVAEYREPWPANMEVPGDGAIPFFVENSEYLRDFERRALAVFAFDTDLADFSGVPQTPQTPQFGRWEKARIAPDVERLAGDIIRITWGEDGNSFK